MKTRFALPEAGLSRTARWCLAGTFLLILGFFVVAGVWWPAWQVYEVTGARPRIDPPISVTAESEHDPEDRCVVSIARDGRPWRKGARCDLADLGTALREEVDAFERRCRTRGVTGTLEIAGGARASRLVLLLRVDRSTPWAAVHDVLRRAGDQGLFRIQFLARPADRWESRSLPAHLPWKGEPRAAIAIGVRRGPDGAAVYTLAGVEAPDPAALRDRLSALRRQADESGQRLTPAIDAARDMPFEAVVKALDELALLFLSVHLEADGIRTEVR